MADRGRYDSDERRGRSDEHRGRGGSIFGSGWSGFGPDPREGPGYEESRSGGRFSGRDDRGERHRESERSGRRDSETGLGDRPGARDRVERSGRDFGYDDRHQGLPIEETSRLIASNKVEGTLVYSRDRHRLGTIYNFMVDKVSGQVEYAVMRYGGFLGMGQRYYPLPWRVLTYHRDAGGYVIDMSARDFEDAPSFDRDSEPEFDRDYGRKVHSWYGLDY
jgi:hypothetical protein